MECSCSEFGLEKLGCSQSELYLFPFLYSVGFPLELDIDCFLPTAECYTVVRVRRYNVRGSKYVFCLGQSLWFIPVMHAGEENKYSGLLERSLSAGHQPGEEVFSSQVLPREEASVRRMPSPHRPTAWAGCICAMIFFLSLCPS